MLDVVLEVCSNGHTVTKQVVSILVVLDVVLEDSYSLLTKLLQGVSILVVLDVVLEVQGVLFC